MVYNWRSINFSHEATCIQTLSHCLHTSLSSLSLRLSPLFVSQKFRIPFYCFSFFFCFFFNFEFLTWFYNRIFLIHLRMSLEKKLWRRRDWDPTKQNWIPLTISTSIPNSPWGEKREKFYCWRKVAIKGFVDVVWEMKRGESLRLRELREIWRQCGKVWIHVASWEKFILFQL